jgi:hypothetical protein
VYDKEMVFLKEDKGKERKIKREEREKFTKTTSIFPLFFLYMFFRHKDFFHKLFITPINNN